LLLSIHSHHNFLKTIFVKKSIALFLVFASVTSAMAQVTTFSFSGGFDSYIVPAGVTSVFVQAWGAQGGSGAAGGASVQGGSGGLGGYAEGFLVVTPGQNLNILVGGQGATPLGGFNGGGNGGNADAGGGGGASDIRVGGTAQANRVIVAGGGGGGGRGGCHEGSGFGGIGGGGGPGGAGAGTNGADSPQFDGVAGGGKGGNFSNIQGAGGSGGDGCSVVLGEAGGTATTGNGANGGTGQLCCCSSAPSVPGGGGGGGGHIGGGGGGGGSAGNTACQGNSKGAGAGGGGGSNYIGGVINGITNNGIWLGNGQVTISPVFLTATATAGPAILCNDGTTTIDVAAVGGLPPYTGAGVNTVAAGVYTYTVTDFSGATFTTDPITIAEPTLFTSNSVIINPTSCNGSNGSINLIPTGGTPGYSFNWSNGAITEDLATLTADSYSVTGTDANGCTFSTTITLTDPPLPVISLSLEDTICSDFPSFVLTGESPTGGVYFGTGVSAGSFNPATASIGNNFITYSFTDINGCTASSTVVINVDLCAGIATYDATGTVNVYPNPTSGMLYITTAGDKNVLTMFDVLGNVVYTIQTTSTLTEIDMKNVINGVYLLKIENATSTSTIRVVRNK
jgi:hypothetical protein